MDNHSDFVELLDSDVSLIVFSFLDDPSDLVRASSVSRSWRRQVIESSYCKKLCLRLFPEVMSVIQAIELDNLIDTKKDESSSSTEFESAERNHRVYAFLAKGLTPILREDCISEAICASSTDNYPEESIQNTLEPRDRVDRRASYWSSNGQSDPRVPETLTYRLASKFCFITEINIQPFQAYFQYGFPIYSAKAVRFRMGHLKSPLDAGSNHLDEFADGEMSTEDFIEWTYLSSEFPMAQENCLQKFKLPQPILCMGGILQIELLGRVQRQEMDNLYYICISHVQVVGRPLSSGFDAEINGPSRECVLKYYPKAGSSNSSSTIVAADDEPGEPSCFHPFTTGLVYGEGWHWEQMIVNTLLGNVPVASEVKPDEDEIA